ncbi:HEAT repeat protein [Histoplasma capsulatum var. duboisii H88]|uniref:HEAT repeat protein n=2 Tax=Ajellomyces capsulatus TaxID=5037 RepID=F0UMI1_AJEC8|nr:HEAT repeat protein [Histoplasma capsulatum H143]EGC47325.1 HEAT repeat protein [Histoplasma capsulatum var. duboisii H88]
MEARATEVLAALKNPNLSIEAKTQQLTKLKSEIKQKNVPEVAISTVFEAVRYALASQHSSLSAGGFSALGHLLKRLSLQDLHQAIAAQGRSTYPLLLERLGDHKERVRSQAAQAFSDFWQSAPVEVEHHVLEIALVGKNPRAKETSMTWLATMTRNRGLLFRTYVPSLVACLEDADSGVRETAKATVIDLFQNAPPRALSDLKKQLQSHNVRKSITNSILSSIGVDQDLSSSMQSQPRSDILRPESSFSSHREPQRPNSVLSTRSISNGEAANPPKPPRGDLPRRDAVLSHSVSVESFPTVVGNAEIVEVETVDPLYLNSHRELDEIFREMLPYFEGRESEQNWILREKSILKLRRITKGNAPTDFQHNYLVGIKSVLDGILKAVNSLRTTLSAAGCSLIQDIARANGPAIDPMVEVLLQNMIKVCASLKKISAQNGNLTVDAIIGNVSYTSRIVQHLWLACQDKNVQPRLFVTGWIQTLIMKHSGHRGLIEHSGGVDVLEKCIKKGLGDANPGVRENMRSTFWTFARMWADRAEGIMSTMDAKSRSLLERDPGNPNLDANSLNTNGRQRTGMGNNGPGGGSRLTLKETIAAQKKARLAAAKTIPARPESAQSSFPDLKSSRSSIHRQPGTTTRTVPTGSHISSQNTSLSSAPMRPSSRPRRPELMRPATADPYSSRNRSVHSSSQQKLSSPSGSPQKPRSKTTTSTPGRSNPTPLRPKSRLDTSAPVSTAKPKPKRLDIAGLKPGEARLMAGPAGKPNYASSVDPKPLAASPARSEENLPIVLLQDDNKNTEISSTSFASDAEVFTENKTDLMTELPTPGSLVMSHGTPSSHRRLSSSDTSVSRIPMSPPFQPKVHSEECLAVTSSPNRNCSNNNDNIAPKNASAGRFSLPSTEVTYSGETLKVYEDPQSPNAKEDVAHPEPLGISPRSPIKANPLEELPINEPANTPNRKYNGQQEPSGFSPPTSVAMPANENLHRRWKKVEISERRRSLSPRSKDPSRGRDMIDRGLNKIRTGAIDVHGYRKVQSLIKYHQSIFNDEAKYGETLMVLLDALEVPDADKKSATGRQLDLKTQVLVTIRLLFSMNRGYFSKYYSRAMTAIITARKHYELTNHIVSGLEETAEDIVQACEPADVIDAILGLLEFEEKSPDSHRMIAMGGYILSGLLRRLNEKNLFLSEPELERLGNFANQSLKDPQPDIRRAVMEFCLELHEMVKPEEAFWRMIKSEEHRPLLTYYIVRKPGR